MRKPLILVIVTGIGYLPLALPAPTQIPANASVTSISYTVPATLGTSPLLIATKPPVRRMYPAVGSATSESVTTAIEFYQKKDITNVGVAYLVGNFVAESGLRPDQPGDDGLALGIAQWHPERRVGLPTTLEGQLEYAWNEIQAYPLKNALYSTNESLLMSAIKRYEGYSVQGKRFEYAQQILQELK